MALLISSCADLNLSAEYCIAPGAGDGGDSILCSIRHTGNGQVLDSRREPLALRGMNLAWYDEDPSEYQAYFEKLAENNINLVRIIMVPWSLDTGWDGVESEYVKGSSEFNAENLDSILESARQKGIYVILVFDIYGELRSKSDDPREMLWNINPLNVGNGGYLEEPSDFFVDEHAKQEYKEKLDYIVGKWSRYPNILAWELWNEVDITDDFNKTAVYSWHKEMISYIKEIDPASHLVTTSFAEPALDFWEGSDADIVTIHIYSDDAVDEIPALVEQHRMFRKPVLIEEFGLEDGGKLGPNDSDEIMLGMFIRDARSAGAIAAMPWWWSENIDANDLYHVVGES